MIKKKEKPKVENASVTKKSKKMEKIKKGYLITKTEYWLINLAIILEFIAFVVAILD